MTPAFPLASRRLLIRPLRYEQAVQYRAGRYVTGADHAYVLSPRLSEAMDTVLLPNLKVAGEDYVFRTIWLMQEKADGAIVGSFLFKGPVNAAGSVEIGYGTEPVFQGKGYMTEAIGATLEWVITRPEVRTVTAETKSGNLASIRVLEKNNFEQYDRQEELLFWRRPVTAQLKVPNIQLL